MPSTYSPDLRIELMANGGNTGTWGTITNTNLGTLIEDAISGLANVSVTSAAQALTVQDGAADQARCAAFNLTTTTTAAFAAYVPPVTKLYVVKNSSIYTATVYASTVSGNTTPAGTGVAIPAGKTVIIRCDGTNIVDQFNYISSDLTVGGNQAVTGTLAVTGASTFAGAVAFSATPTAPTAAPGTNTTQLATTAYTTTAITNAVTNIPVSLTDWALAETSTTQTATITIASPAVVTVTTAPAAGTAIMFTTTGSLPTGLATATPYYVFNRTSTTYNVATTLGQSQTATYATATPSTFVVAAAPTNGQVVYFSTGCPSGITAGLNYYVVNRTTTTFQVSLTSGGSALSFSGSGTCTATWQSIVTTTGSQTGTHTENTSKLYFKYKTVNKMSVDLGGNTIASGNVTAFGTP